MADTWRTNCTCPGVSQRATHAPSIDLSGLRRSVLLLPALLALMATGCPAGEHGQPRTDEVDASPAATGQVSPVPAGQDSAPVTVNEPTALPSVPSSGPIVLTGTVEGTVVETDEGPAAGTGENPAAGTGENPAAGTGEHAIEGPVEVDLVLIPAGTGQDEGDFQDRSMPRVSIPAPLAATAIPENWPSSIPCPPGIEIDRQTPPEQAMVSIQGHHPGDFRELAQWFVIHLSDAGWLVQSRDRLGLSIRLRLALDRQRWLITVSRDTDDEGIRSSLVAIRRQINEPPLRSLPGLAAGSQCDAALAPTSGLGPVRCELVQGAPVRALGREIAVLDAAVDEDRIGIVFLSGRELWTMVLDGGEVAGGPAVLTDIDLGDPRECAPQILDGGEAGWLVSWIDGDPPRRRLLLVSPEGQVELPALDLTLTLGRLEPTGWSVGESTVQPEYRMAWVEQVGNEQALRLAGIMVPYPEQAAGEPDLGLAGIAAPSVGQSDSEQIVGLDGTSASAFPVADDGPPLRLGGTTAQVYELRPSGRFPFQSAPSTLGPIVATAPDGHSGLAWASIDGFIFRAIGPDGLPDEPEHRLEPGEPRSVALVYADSSYWAVWGTEEAGFWIRADRHGCTDDARGSLSGWPLGAWSTPLGVLVEVRDASETRLVRLADRGLEGPDQQPEVLGRFPEPVVWSSLEPRGESLVGLIRLEESYQLAEWRCYRDPITSSPLPDP